MAKSEVKNIVFTIKTLKTKVIEFIVMYGILSVFSFSGAHSVAKTIFDNLSTFFTSDLYIDGTDFSILSNLFAVPVYLTIVAINIIITLTIDIILILILKKLYFKSGVEKEEKEELYKYIKIVLAGFVIFGLMTAVTIFGNMKGIIVYMLSYLPVPLMVFSIVRTQFRKMYRAEQFNTSRG